MELLPAILTVPDVDAMLSIQVPLWKEGAAVVKREAWEEITRLLDLRNDIKLRTLGLSELETL